jgi:hypothetical protein
VSGSQLLLLGGTPQVASDPNFEYTTLLLPGNGTNGAQNNTFLDGSTNNFTITRNGNTTQGTFSPFSQTGWGNYFDGTGDYLTTPSSANLAVGTGDFCVEMWVFTPAASATQVLYANTTTGDTGLIISIVNTTAVRLTTIATTLLTTATSLIVANQWNHIAVCRSGTTASIFVNGSRGASSTITKNFSATDPFYIGSSATPGDYLTGYISNLRTVKGASVYDPTQTTLTIPTAPLTAITNTQLLTCQSNRFIDNSTNAFAITRNGNVSVQAFSPFNPTSAYSTSSVGGSGYFDGSGDYLTAPDSAASEIGASNFCVEGWFYPTVSSASYQTVFCKNQAGISGGFGPIYITFLSGVLRAYSGSTTAWNVLSNVTIGTPQLNAWNHFVVCRSGANWGLYLNGTRNNTASSTATLLNNTANYGIGAQPDGAETTTGYLSGIRLVIGSSVYDPTQSTLTVPTAPLTAISGTSLLLNYTNAGIYDATSKNDLETVGNAQISTTQSKFGGSSMYFDGTGDYLVTDAPSTDLFAFGSGDFTIEFWVYFNSVSGFPVPYDGRASGANSTTPTIYLVSGTIRYYVSAADRITGSTLSASTWYHVAICRVASQTKMFIDGTQVGSTYADTTVYTNTVNRPIIGGDGNAPGSNGLNGYIDDLRITKGIARYTANFTAPTAAFPLL